MNNPLVLAASAVASLPSKVHTKLDAEGQPSQNSKELEVCLRARFATEASKGTREFGSDLRKLKEVRSWRRLCLASNNQVRLL